MLMEVEISSFELIKRLLENHSPEFIFETVARFSNHISPEEFGEQANKLLEKGIE